MRIDDPAAQTELHAALNAAIDDLPPAYRVAIVLRDDYKVPSEHKA